MPSSDSVFEFLFKYRRPVFESGRFTLSNTAYEPFVMAFIAIAIAASLWSYARLKSRARLTMFDVAFLAGLRVTAILLAGLSLLEPILRVMTVTPQQTFVGVLVDDSQSLTIKDDAGKPRGEFAQTQVVDPSGTLRQALEQKFKLRFFRFSKSAERLQAGEGLSLTGGRTDLASALRHARDELSDVPLSGLVLLSDGADNAAGPLSETLLDLRTQQVPVFTIGLGRPAFDKDVEITRVEAPTSVLQGSSVVASITLKAQGVGSEGLTLTVEDSGRILSTQEVHPTSSESSAVRVTIRADEPGPRLLQFKVRPIQGEIVTENNQMNLALDVVARREKILYLEGATRFETKFLRKAVQDDKNLQVVTLERTSDQKFLRLDVDDAEELAAGFPKSREELFRYRGLVVGGIEGSFFTVDQTRMIADFVSQRGGGLLMIGSDKSFAEGGYAGTAVAEALPVAFDQEDAAQARATPAPAGDAKTSFRLLKVKVTPLGAAQPLTQLAATESLSEERFRALPPLSTVNRVTRVKPGASALLVGETPEGRDGDFVVLASQRYGRGRAMAFTPQDSWRWQMHADVAVDDTSHETFWRQMLRQLVSGVSGPVALTLSSGLVPPSSTVAIHADVSDETFIRLNDASVSAIIKSPAGATAEIPLRWTVEKDGEYAGEFRAEERGVYEVRVSATKNGKTVGEDLAHVRVDEVPFEFRDAEMKPDLLKRIASETGGRFYTKDTAASVADDLSYSPKTATVVSEKELWDMPAIFLGILACLSIEWPYRKFRGLA